VRGPQKTRIGDFAYTVMPIPAGEGLRATARVASIVAPVFEEMTGGVNAGAMVSALLGNPDLAAHLEYFTTTFAAHTRVVNATVSGGQPQDLSIAFDQHFAGAGDELVQWLVFAFEVNLSGFFAGLPVLLAKAKARADAAKALAKQEPSASPSPA
jgi:hypothetical protein